MSDRPLSFFADPSELRAAKSNKQRVAEEAEDYLLGGGCSACGLYKRCKSPQMLPSGRGVERVAVVGKSPGKDEDEVGKPFVGASGEFLRRSLSAVGLSMRTACWLLNAAQCHPEENKLPPRAPLCCWPRVDEQLKELKPRVIACMGNTAVQSVLRGVVSPAWGITGLHGRMIPSWRYGAWVVCCLHPAGVLRSRQAEGGKRDTTMAFTADLLALVQAIDVPFSTRIDQTYEDLSGDARAAVDALRWFSEPHQQIVAMDYETNQLDMFSGEPKVLSLALSNGKRSVAIPLDHPQALWSPSDRQEIVAAIKAFLLSETPKSAHSIEFESTVSRQVFGVEMVGIDADTMIAAHTLDHRRRTCSLEFQAATNFGESYKGEVDRAKLEEEDLPKVLQYNARDAIFTRELDVRQRKQVWEHKQCTNSMGYELFMRAAPVLAKLHQRGVGIDLDEMREQSQEMGVAITELEAKIKASRLVPRGFSVGSKDDLSELLYGKLGLVPIKRTSGGKRGKGRPSVVAKCLEAHIRDLGPDHNISRLLRLCLDREHLVKLKGYLDGYGQVVGDDGCLHPSYLLHTTNTYRSSSENPNFQNVPKRSEEGKRLRRVIVPHIGQWFLEADYASAEVRVIAMLSGDERLIEQVIAGYDFHRFFAAGLFMKVEAEISKQERYLGKNQFVFPLFYGSYYKSIADSIIGMGVPIEDYGFTSRDDFLDHVAEQQDRFWHMYPQVQQWQNKLLRLYDERGYVEMPFGFHRYGPLGRNEVINTPVQGTAFHLLLDGLVRAEARMLEEGMASRIISEVHDSITVDTVEEEIPAVVRVLRECLTTPRFVFEREVPLEIECSIGRNWCDMVEFSLERAA